ncbi:tripartite motif-containing protein 75-like [Sorex fumeus]|uniref:tripartite motif-containing protein 75-like n=1 Tax=Sorex fumeus TaxID=62283 RepID=UPI0024AD1994|nr:tripartite motif-containing protein 75-like [Sorex fumeus]
MAVSSVLTKLQAEVICPICLDYLNNPFTIICGHSFCASCIKMSWKDLQENFPCPLCRYPQEERYFRANHHLGRLVDLAKLLHRSNISQMRQEEEDMCEEHNQVLSFFCEDEQKLVCLLCIQTPAHQGHLVRPVEEAVLHHRQRLSQYVEPLKKQLVKMQKLVVTHDRKLQRLSYQIEKQIDQLGSEMGQLNLLVDYEREATFSRLDEENKHQQQKLGDNITAISDHIDTMNDLFKELVERSVMCEGNLLREVKSIQHRCENLASPTVCSVQFKKEGYCLPPLYSVFDNIVQKFQEEVTLDPRTAHPSLYISEDRKVAIYVKQRSKVDGKPILDLDDVVVLGSEGFSSGRHYWEVQVGDKPKWAIGVCTDATTSSDQWPLSGQNQSWMVQLQDGNYLARGSVPVLLSLKDKPTGIGIYLDYELGQISFYDASDRSHIHSFLEKFSDVLKPYFCVGQDSTPLVVSAVTDSTE